MMASAADPKSDDTIDALKTAAARLGISDQESLRRRPTLVAAQHTAFDAHESSFNFKEGSRVEVNIDGKKWRKATIRVVNDDGSYDIAYNESFKIEGDFNVPADDIQGRGNKQLKPDQNMIGSGSMAINVKTLSGKVLRLNVEPGDTVADAKELIKELIERGQGIPTYQQRLIFDGEQLEDDKELSNYDIRKGSSLLHLILHQLQEGATLLHS